MYKTSQEIFQTSGFASSRKLSRNCQPLQDTGHAPRAGIGEADILNSSALATSDTPASSNSRI